MNESIDLKESKKGISEVLEGRKENENKNAKLRKLITPQSKL